MSRVIYYIYFYLAVLRYANRDRIFNIEIHMELRDSHKYSENTKHLLAQLEPIWYIYY